LLYFNNRNAASYSTERSSSYKLSKSFDHSSSLGLKTSKFGFGADVSYSHKSFRDSKQKNTVQVFSVESGEVFLSKVKV